MIAINFSDNLLIPNQLDWLNKDYTEIWNNEVIPLYMLCLQKCVILEACERHRKIICTKFRTPNEDIIEFYPHWERVKFNEDYCSRIDLIERLTQFNNK